MAVVYAQEPKVNTRLRNQKVLKFRLLERAIAKYPNPAVLELGSGAGSNLRSLSKGIKHGVDLDAESIRKGVALGGANYLVGDVAKLPYAARSFEVVFGVDIIEHVPDIPAVLREAKRVMKDDGSLFLHVPCEMNFFYGVSIRMGFDPKKEYGGHIQRLKTKELVAYVEETGFRITDLRYNYHLVGQTRDFLKYVIIHLKTKRDHSEHRDFSSLDIERLLASDPSDTVLSKVGKATARKAMRLMDRFSYYESAVLRRVPLCAMGVNIIAVKDEGKGL